MAEIDVCGSLSVDKITLREHCGSTLIVSRELWVCKLVCSGCWLLPTVHGLCQLCAWRLMCAAVQTIKLDQKGSKRFVLRWRLATALHCSIWTAHVSGLLGGVLVVRVIELWCCSASG